MKLLFASSDVVSHLKDYKFLGEWLTAHHVLLIMVALVMILGFWWVARRSASGTPSGLASLVEVSLVWVRDEIVYEWLGPQNGRKYLYFFWTLFFFILFSNLLGLLPAPLNLWHRTATGNINETAALALITFVLVQVSGMLKHGWGKYWAHLVPGGVPKVLFPLVWLIEFFSIFVKPFALTVRLFANMTAGHAIVAVLVSGLIGITAFSGAFIGGISTVSAFAFMLFIMLFETLVALIQAYIFTILSVIFVSLAVAEEH